MIIELQVKRVYFRGHLGLICEVDPSCPQQRDHHEGETEEEGAVDGHVVHEAEPTNEKNNKNTKLYKRLLSFSFLHEKKIIKKERE